jgi:hypothetical protein
VADTELSNGALAIPTFECLGIYWNPSSGSSDNECLLTYREQGQLAWRQGLSLWHAADSVHNIPGGDSSEFLGYRGSIVNLKPGTTYEIMLTLASNGETAFFPAATWNENFPVARTVLISSQSTQLVIDSSYSGDSAGYTLIQAESGSEIDVKNIEDSCIEVRDAHHVIIRGFTLKGAGENAILLSGAQDIVIEQCDISGWGEIATETTPVGRTPNEALSWGVNYHAAIASPGQSGIEYRSIERIIIQFNKIHDPRSTSNSWFEQAYSQHPEGPQAIYMYETAGHHVIRYNDIYSTNGHYYNDAIGGNRNFYNGDNPPRGFPNCDTDIYGNYIENAWDEGIESEGANRNVRIWSNFITKTYAKIACAETAVGPLYIWKNVAGTAQVHHSELYKNDGTYWMEWWEWPYTYFLKTDARQADGRIYVFHNTLLQPPNPYEPDYSTIGCGFGLASVPLMGNIVSRNNIFHVNDSGHMPITDWNDANVVNCDFSNDLISIDRVPSAAHDMILGIPEYSPDFTIEPDDTGAGTFTLSPSSPGYDTGVVIPNFNDNYNGSAPDAGAHEAGTGSLVYGILGGGE